MPQLYKETLGAGPDLVLLHGWGMSSTIWRPVLQSLVEKYRVTCIDLPGHGHSPEMEWPSEQVIDLLLNVAPSRAYWMGWSLGGMLAAMLAAKDPARVTGLITVSASPRFTQTNDWPSAMPEDQLLSFAQELEQDPSAVLKRFIALQFLGASVDRQTIRRLQQEVGSQPASIKALQQGFELLRLLDLREAFADIQLPMLALFGERDRLVPSRVAMDIKKRNPSMQTYAFVKAGHAPFISHPTQFLDQVTSFVRS